LGFLKPITAFIAWLSGSLAALAAVFYAFGYLITLANLQMLGLDSLVLGFDPDFYIQRGARFVLYVLRLTLEFTLSPITAIVLVVTLGLALGRISARAGIAGIPKWIKTFYGRVAGWITRNAAIVYTVLLLILLQHLFQVYENTTSPFRISELLFRPPDAAVAGPGNETGLVVQALIRRDIQALRLKFLFTLILLAETGFFLYLAWRVTHALKPRILLVAPFALIFAMSVIALPMVYGIIVLPNAYPTVRLARTGANEVTPERYFLMNASNDFLVLWDSRATRLLWVPQGDVKRLEIGRRCPLPLAGGTGGDATASTGDCL